MTKVGTPKIDLRPEQPYVGIRVQTPMRGLSTVLSKLFKEINKWVEQHGIEPSGVPFNRFHVIDMDADMDVEVGVPVTAETAAKVPLDEKRVKAGVLPAGRYASLIYSGSGYAGNKVLVEWAAANGIKWDRWEDSKGDAFRSRYESYLTDPKVEPRKTKWDVEVAIKLADDSSEEPTA